MLLAQTLGTGLGTCMLLTMCSLDDWGPPWAVLLPEREVLTLAGCWNAGYQSGIIEITPATARDLSTSLLNQL